MEKYTRLSELSGKEITINGVGEFNWKSWDNENRKMLSSDSWQEGYKKRYPLDTDKGKLEVSQTQMGKILEAVSYRGKADVIGRAVSIKSDGKEIPDYYFNAVKKQTDEAEITDEELEHMPEEFLRD